MKLILTKEKVNENKYSYKVREAASGIVHAERVSERDYIACTADGELWFTDEAAAQRKEQRNHMKIVWLS